MRRLRFVMRKNNEALRKYVSSLTENQRGTVMLLLLQARDFDRLKEFCFIWDNLDKEPVTEDSLRQAGFSFEDVVK